MTDKMNLSSFLNLFDTPTDAIDYILKANDDGKVETIEYTLPYYTLVSPSKPQTDTGNEYDRLAQPPRFISYACSTQIHSYEVAITGLSLTMVIEFPMGDSGAIDWFTKNLQHALSDGYGGFECEEVNITDPYDLECMALGLQHETNLNRVFDIREFITKTDTTYMTDAQFERNCRDLVELTDTNKAITERIEYINDVQYISQLA
jgi:hypothetical protein